MPPDGEDGFGDPVNDSIASRTRKRPRTGRRPLRSVIQRTSPSHPARHVETIDVDDQDEDEDGVEKAGTRADGGPRNRSPSIQGETPTTGETGDARHSGHRRGTSPDITAYGSEQHCDRPDATEQRRWEPRGSRAGSPAFHDRERESRKMNFKPNAEGDPVLRTDPDVEDRHYPTNAGGIPESIGGEQQRHRIHHRYRTRSSRVLDERLERHGEANRHGDGLGHSPVRDPGPQSPIDQIGHWAWRGLDSYAPINRSYGRNLDNRRTQTWGNQRDALDEIDSYRGPGHRNETFPLHSRGEVYGRAEQERRIPRDTFHTPRELRYGHSMTDRMRDRQDLPRQRPPGIRDGLRESRIRERLDTIGVERRASDGHPTSRFPTSMERRASDLGDDPRHEYGTRNSGQGLRNESRIERDGNFGDRSLPYRSAMLRHSPRLSTEGVPLRSPSRFPDPLMEMERLQGDARPERRVSGSPGRSDAMREQRTLGDGRGRLRPTSAGYGIETRAQRSPASAHPSTSKLSSSGGASDLNKDDEVEADSIEEEAPNSAAPMTFTPRPRSFTRGTRSVLDDGDDVIEVFENPPPRRVHTNDHRGGRTSDSPPSDAESREGVKRARQGNSELRTRKRQAENHWSKVAASDPRNVIADSIAVAPSEAQNGALDHISLDNPHTADQNDAAFVEDSAYDESDPRLYTETERGRVVKSSEIQPSGGGDETHVNGMSEGEAIGLNGSSDGYASEPASGALSGEAQDDVENSRKFAARHQADDVDTDLASLERGALSRAPGEASFSHSTPESSLEAADVDDIAQSGGLDRSERKSKVPAVAEVEPGLPQASTASVAGDAADVVHLEDPATLQHDGETADDSPLDGLDVSHLGIDFEETKVKTTIARHEIELKYIRSLSLRRCGLTEEALGSLIPTIASLDGTEELQLDQNKLKDLPPNFKSLRDGLSLTSLSVASNLLCAIPKTVLQFRTLVWLDLSRNRLTEIPSEIVQLESLEVLVLSWNRIATLPRTGIGDMKKLEVLNLAHNCLTELPADMGVGNDALHCIDVSFNERLWSPLPQGFATLQKAVDHIGLQGTGLLRAVPLRKRKADAANLLTYMLSEEYVERLAKTRSEHEAKSRSSVGGSARRARGAPAVTLEVKPIRIQPARSSTRRTVSRLGRASEPGPAARVADEESAARSRREPNLFEYDDLSQLASLFDGARKHGGPKSG